MSHFRFLRSFYIKLSEHLLKGLNKMIFKKYLLIISPVSVRIKGKGVGCYHLVIIGKYGYISRIVGKFIAAQKTKLFFAYKHKIFDNGQDNGIVSENTQL